jgi:hypothetical protein
MIKSIINLFLKIFKIIIFSWAIVVYYDIVIIWMVEIIQINL